MEEQGENILRDGERFITFFSSTSNKLNIIAKIPRVFNMAYSSLRLGLPPMSLAFLTNCLNFIASHFC